MEATYMVCDKSYERSCNRALCFTIKQNFFSLHSKCIKDFLFSMCDHRKSFICWRCVQKCIWTFT